MKRTGIFFTYFQGDRLRDFPQALEGLLCRENIFYYDALYDSTDGLFYLGPAGESELLKVHSREGEYGDKGLSPDCHPPYCLPGQVPGRRCRPGQVHRHPVWWLRPEYSQLYYSPHYQLPS